jgi:predicted negative regulator of RcsB-dependent stress response
MAPTFDAEPEGSEPVTDELDTERPARSVLRSSRSGDSPRAPYQIAIVVAVVVLAAVAALAWRSHHRRQVVSQGLERATALLRTDTDAGRREAAQLLEPLVELDPVKAGATRALALSLLALDQRDEEAARRAEALLVEPGRASQVPAEADLAYGALALSRREAGTALSYAARVTDSPWAPVLQARVALLAGKVDVARDPLDRAVAADPSFPAVQALRGDVLRRTGHVAQAREAYAAALAGSPTHPRAIFGLAKLALGGAGPVDEARDGLRRLLDDSTTPAPERARAAYHLASLEARAGRAAESSAALSRAGVEGEARAWLQRAVAEQAQGAGYHVVASAPSAVTSASDDDPWVAPAKAPPPTAVSPTFRLPEPAPGKPSGKATPAKPATHAVAASAKKAPAKKVAHAHAKGAKPAGKVAARTVAKKAPAKKASPAQAKTAVAKAPAKASASPAPSALDAALSKVKATRSGAKPASDIPADAR